MTTNYLSRKCYTETMEILKSLEQLGLSHHESAVYLALVKLGTSQAGPIVKHTKLHRMIVYQTLERLAERGLVSVVHLNNIKSFQPASPKLLVDQSKQLVKLAESAVQELDRLRPRAENAVEVKTFVGTEGFKKVLWELLESAARSPGKEQCILGGAGASGSDPIEVASDYYAEYVVYGQSLGVKKRTIVLKANVKSFQEQYAIHPGHKLRVLTSGLSSPMLTRITPEMVSIEIYQPEITIILIKNALIAKSYLETFNILWKVAEEVSK